MMKTETKRDVVVTNGRYVLSGDILKAKAELGQPIYDTETGALLGITKPRSVTHMHSYGGEGEFFAGLAAGKLLAMQCVNADCEGFNNVHLPFRVHCPDCLDTMKVVDLTAKANEAAEVYSYIVTARTGAFNTLATPIRFIDIEIPGVCTMLKSYLLGDKDPSFGMKVKPVFRTDATYTILDLAWVTGDTETAPEGYAFGK